MAHYKYQIFIPGGNKTALVLGLDGLENDIVRRKEIQDKIMAERRGDRDGEVEQVGFISLEKPYHLVMTGGEFCGNAMRAAVAYYLNGRKGEIELTVSGASKPLSAGISVMGETWAQMPVFDDLCSSISHVQNGMYWVSIEGISHLIVPQTLFAAHYSDLFGHRFESPKSMASRLLKKVADEHSLDTGNACGIIFLENVVDVLKMHPFVYVKEAGTTYYESGCGSGAICVGLVSSSFRKESVSLSLLQPSGKFIRAEVDCSENGNKIIGKISGIVEHGNIYEVEV